MIEFIYKAFICYSGRGWFSGWRLHAFLYMLIHVDKHKQLFLLLKAFYQIICKKIGFSTYFWKLYSDFIDTLYYHICLIFGIRWKPIIMYMYKRKHADNFMSFGSGSVTIYCWFVCLYSFWWMLVIILSISFTFGRLQTVNYFKRLLTSHWNTHICLAANLYVSLLQLFNKNVCF